MNQTVMKLIIRVLKFNSKRHILYLFKWFKSKHDKNVNNQKKSHRTTQETRIIMPHTFATWKSHSMRISGTRSAITD